MGVVKNLMVRVGADVRGVVNGMKSARSATAQASDGIKKSGKETKRSIIDAFTAPAKAVKEYTTTVTETRAKHQATSQNVEVLTDKLIKLEETYGTIKNATDGMDLSQSLSQQITDTEKSLEGINAKIHKTQAAINAIGNAKSAGKAARLESLKIELQNLTADSDAAAAHLTALDQAAAKIGPSNMGAASAAGLKQMEQEIINTRNELTVTKQVAAELGTKLQSLKLGPTLLAMLRKVGSAAAQAAGSGVKKLGNGIKNLAVGAAKGVVSLPGKLLKIGKSASSSCGGLQKMVRSIRNIGIASLGMRVATGMFGKLRSIVSSYIYQNDALNASVTSLKNQLGEALLPAINLVMTAMQSLMPVIKAVSGAINSIFEVLFGKAEATSSAIQNTAEAAGAAAESLDTYGFDQITKVSDNSGGGSSDGSSGSTATDQAAEQSSLVKKLTGWIQELKAAFVEGDWSGLGQIVGDGINSVIAAIDAVDWGAKAGTFANNLFTSLRSAVTTIDFTGIGATAGQMLTSAMGQSDWKAVGEILGKRLLMLPSIGVGFVLNADWALIGQSVTECTSGALQTVTDWIRGVDWLQLGECAATLIANVNWKQLANDLFTFFGTALGAGVTQLWGFINGAVRSIKSYFTEKIKECGGNVALGLLKGILDGLGNIVLWVYQNVVTPFLNGFKSINLGMQNAFNSLWTGIKGVINTIIGGVENMVNWVIDGVNGLIRAFNKVASVGEYFGLELEVSEIGHKSLPRLAKGTIVDGPTAAIIGEEGKEAVMPLENHTGWITDLAQKINQQSGSKATSLALAIYFRSRKLAEYVIQDINQITKEKGQCPIYI